MFAAQLQHGASERARLGRYLTAARVAAVAVCALTTVFRMEPSTGPLPPYLTLSVLLLYNAVAGAFTLRAWVRGGTALLSLIVADLVQATVIVGATGAFDSAHFAIFLFAAAEAALYFDWRVGFAVVVSMNGIQVVATGIRLATSGKAVSFSPIESRFLLLVVVGLLFVVLSENMRREEKARRAAERAANQVANLNEIYAQMGEAHLRVDRVFDAVFAAAESVGGVLFSAILNRAASASEWRVVATSRAEMCPIGKPVTGDFLTVDEADSTQDPRTVEGSGVEALFPCMAGADCRQLVACNMPAYSQAEEGILAVGRSECRPLDEEDENFLRALAMQAQLAIHNALLYRRRDQDFQRLKEFNKMQDTFFSAAAHELKTPLTVLGVLASTLQMTVSDPSPEQSEMFATIEQNILRLKAHTGNMLAAARLEVGDIALNQRMIDPKRVVLRSLDMLQTVLRDRDITADIKPRSAWPRVAADPDRLGEVFLNLLSNASKFAPAHSHVSVAYEGEPQEACFSVCDCGPGVPEGERERIFDKGYSGKDAGSRAGTGLGLYIVKQLVALHGGKIAVQSSSGSTCFRISLPNIELEDG